MNIVVCVKQVPDTEVERSLVPGDNTVDRASVDGVINYLDEFAIEEGLKIETDHFVPLVGSTVSRNLIAIFFMTQRLAKDPGVADASVQPRNVERVGVIP